MSPLTGCGGAAGAELVQVGKELVTHLRLGSFLDVLFCNLVSPYLMSLIKQIPSNGQIVPFGKKSAIVLYNIR